MGAMEGEEEKKEIKKMVNWGDIDRKTIIERENKKRWMDKKGNEKIDGQKRKRKENELHPFSVYISQEKNDHGQTKKEN